jgi:hypothetical protein
MLKPTPKTTVLIIIALTGLTLVFFWKILLTNQILVGVDTFLYFYPYKAYAAETLRQGRLPLWNPHLFMGAPLLANSQVGVLYPLNWPLLWLAPPKQVAWSIGLHIVLAALFMLAYGRRSLRLSRPGALTAAILFAFGGYLGAQVEHINQLNAAAWLPLLFLLVDLIQTRPGQRWRYTLALAAVIALILLAGHAQTAFIALFGLGLYTLWTGITESPNQRSSEAANSHAPFTTQRGYLLRFAAIRYSLRSAAIRYSLFALRSLWPLALASILGAALAAVQLLPTAELSDLSIRSGGLTYREVVSFSLRPTTLHYALLPPFGLDLSTMLGQAFSEWVAYTGFTGLTLALLGALQAVCQRRPRRYLFLAACGLALSLGMFSGPLYLALYYTVPGFNLFRVPARWLLLYAFALAALAGFGLDALLTPAAARSQLAGVWRWLRARPWRLALPGLPLLGLLALIAWKTPPVNTLVAWLGLAIISAGLVISLLRFTTIVPGAKRSGIYDLRFTLYVLHPTKIIPSALILLLLAELFWAAQTLNYNRPTAPHAYHSMRNAVAFLRSADPPTGRPEPPGRFLSLSGITYDPGDLRELEQIFSPALSAEAVYNMVVAAKEKEVLFFNLPLLYGLHSVDGYDGGILPLRRFVTLQQLFLPPDDLSPDGRLREKLKQVPPARLLSMLNTRWIITDKQFDVWIDDIFYDLQFPARLASGQSIGTADLPAFPATALGVVSHLEGATQLAGNTPVATLRLTFADGAQATFTLRAGPDTAEGAYPAHTAHPRAKIGVAWPHEAAGVDYVTVLPLGTTRQVTRVEIIAALPAGRFVLRGLSLINQPTATSRSVLLSTEGRYRQVHSGDVKIYENLDALPRATLVHQAIMAADDAAAVAALQQPAFDPRHTVVLTGPDGPEHVTRGRPAPKDSAAIHRYAPEHVTIITNAASPAWLVLADAHYPGWQAKIDGASVDIIPANVLFRAVPVPAGQHTVTFDYIPRTVQIGAIISAAALALLIAGLILTAKQ